MGNRKRKHREPLFWLEAAFIVLLLAGAYVIGSYARAKQSDSLQEVFVADLLKYIFSIIYTYNV